MFFINFFCFCSIEYRVKKKTKFKITLIFVLSCVFVLKTYFSVCNILLEKGKADFEAEMTQAFYSSLSAVIADGNDFKELVRVERTADGSVSFLSTDALKLNSLAKSIAEGFENAYECLYGGVVRVPIGAFLGSRFFSGAGALVNLKLITVSSVRCDFLSYFESVGINQTRHRLYVEAIPEAVIVTAAKTERVSVKIKLPVYDNLIVGKVPEAYFSGVIAGYSTAN